MLEVSEVLHKNAEPLKVKLIKCQKDSYGWEISCAGSDFNEIIEQIKTTDGLLKEYCGKVE